MNTNTSTPTNGTGLTHASSGNANASLPDTTTTMTPRVADILDQVQSKPAEAEPTREDAESGLVMEWNRSSNLAGTNLDFTKPFDQALISRCRATADLKTRNVAGQTIAVIGYIVHPARITDPITGEIKDLLRAVLVLEDLKTVSTCSKACIEHIKFLRQTQPEHLWDPPVMIEVREIPSLGGKSYCEMRAPMPPRPAKNGKK